jgi:hypothetical protein
MSQRGKDLGMNEDRGEDREDEPNQSAASSTSPPGGKTHEATTPPGQGDRDEDATREAEDKLDQAGGGH